MSMTLCIKQGTAIRINKRPSVFAGPERVPQLQELGLGVYPLTSSSVANGLSSPNGMPASDFSSLSDTPDRK